MDGFIETYHWETLLHQVEIAEGTVLAVMPTQQFAKLLRSELVVHPKGREYHMIFPAKVVRVINRDNWGAAHGAICQHIIVYGEPLNENERAALLPCILR